MMTKELIELTRKTKELYLEEFEMKLEDALEANYTKQVDTWKLYDQTSLSDAKRDCYWDNIQALRAEEAALRQLYATNKKELSKVRKY